MSVRFLIVMMLALGIEAVPLLPPARIGMRVVGVALGMLAVVALARLIGVWTVGRVQHHPHLTPRIGRWYHRIACVQEALSLGYFLAVLYLLQWPAVVRHEFHLGGIPILPDIVILLPYLLAEIASMVCFYPAECILRRSQLLDVAPERDRWRLRSYLNFQIRSQYGIWLASGMAMSLLRDLANWLNPQWTESPGTALGFTLGMSMCVLAVSPLLIRYVWKASPLPDGPLRRRLNQLAKKLRFRATDVLVWHTGNGVINAAIAGAFPQLRYVFLSDALIEEMTHEEIAAVFGHEVGHIRHHHLTFYFAFLILSTAMLGTASFLGQIVLQSHVTERSL